MVLRIRAEVAFGLICSHILYGGDDANFTSFRAGTGYLNLTAQPAERQWNWLGRVIFYDSDVDGLHARLVAAGYMPSTPPRDAGWGERFFHIDDPDGHDKLYRFMESIQEFFDLSSKLEVSFN